ncbi:hypothetical protein [Geitlerinema sp. PCC 9228]|jgi:hypothetical protein|uniref:hypothetical protein n=1 Tax=Geitlerinema sp. PCC 9228 TaxID=111611 RepID=UPI0014819C35|nr:hypothetical protein [Geitlerinema sp. PCC 9228]
MYRPLVLVVAVGSSAIAFFSPAGKAIPFPTATEVPEEQPSESTEECRWLGTCYR